MYLISLIGRAMKSWKSLLHVGSFLVMAVSAVACLAASSCAADSTKVFIKPNPQKSTASDIFLKEPGKGKAAKFLTISDVYRGHYHAAEYHKGHLYIIRRTGGDEGYRTNPHWTDELWRYSKNGKGTKIWTSRGLDFRVREDERLVAVLSSPGSDQIIRNNLYLIATDGKPVKSFTSAKLASKDLDFLRWAGKYLWVKDQEAMEIYGFVRFDTESMLTKKYDIYLADTDFDLNTESLLLAYSNYPIMFDTIDEEEFEAKKTPVKLFVYDLKTKKNRLISRTVAKPFNPKWIGPKTLNYANPVGKGTVTKQIQ